MSTYYGLYCHDCHRRTGAGMNHGGPHMRSLIRLAPLLKAVQDADTAWTLDIRTEYFFDFEPPAAERGEDAPGSVVEWMVAHADHRLQVYDEYGYFYDENLERIADVYVPD